MCARVCVCVCPVCASEAHLVAGLLVRGDRRVIMGALDWLPVKFESFAKRGNKCSCDTHTHTHSQREIRPLHMWS